MENFLIYRSSRWIFLKVLSCFVMGIAFFTYCYVVNSYSTLIISIIYFILGFYFLTKKNNSDKIYIEIDKDGIWVNQQQVCNWREFITAKIEPNYENQYTNYSFKANKIIKVAVGYEVHITHFKEGESGYFIYKINFNGTEDKTEHDLVKAVHNYHLSLIESINMNNQPIARLR